MSRNMEQRPDGTWGPAVPEPFHGVSRMWCPAPKCTKSFRSRNRESYRAHYLKEHVS